MINFQDGEKIIRVCRRHWFGFLGAVFPIAVIILGFLASPFLFKIFAPEFFKPYASEIFLGSVLFLEILWIILFIVITDFYLDVWMITNQRLVFIELNGLFNRTVASVSLKNIQDISVTVNGILATFLKFGSVKIQSAGTEGEFVFKQIAQPYKVKDLILETKSLI